ncbi:MAG: hypothetical protein KC457_14035 [Myxococcales bacterium]|nr:hypothetical protein [Myxococcales bacterium]
MIGRTALESMLHERVRDPAVFRALLTEVPGEAWRELQARVLTRALTRALDAPYWRTRVDLSPARIAADPFAAVLAFPALDKQAYWDHGPALRLDDVAVDLRFYTSGTERGTPTEQPWDRWTFDKSFGEASALALCAIGARTGDRLLIGSPGFGAVGLAFAYAAALLDLSPHADARGFADAETFAATLAFVAEGVDLLVGAPGNLVMLARRLEDAGIDPRTLGVRGIITGVGTFAGDRDIAFMVDCFAPELIHEMGGKNEILHAPGGRRHRAPALAASHGLSEAGMLHVLPWAAHVVAVDRQAFAAGEQLAIAHGEPGVLLMTRLAAGGSSCVAFVNDAGDCGRTRGFGGVDSPPSPCGNAMPAFAFAGRLAQAVCNKIGDTIFVEELLRTLGLAAADLRLAPVVAAALRVQVVLVHAADPLAADTMYWIIGVPPGACSRETMSALGRRWIERWPRHDLYRRTMAAVMGFAGFAIIDQAALPHAGRDKPQYPPGVVYHAAADEPAELCFERHLDQILHARVLLREAWS